jgi:hypothetical protein
MSAVYEFGAFRLDPAERLLLRDAHPVPLTPKAFDLLVYLLEHHGHLVQKREAECSVWPDCRRRGSQPRLQHLASTKSAGPQRGLGIDDPDRCQRRAIGLLPRCPLSWASCRSMPTPVSR